MKQPKPMVMDGDFTTHFVRFKQAFDLLMVTMSKSQKLVKVEAAILLSTMDVMAEEKEDVNFL